MKPEPALRGGRTVGSRASRPGRPETARMNLAYTVTARFEEIIVADEFLHWLRHGHMQAVMDGGADRAEVVRWTEPEEEQHTITVRYRFPDRSIFERYVAHHAEELRDEGAERFPPSRGVTFSRTVGEILLPV